MSAVGPIGLRWPPMASVGLCWPPVPVVDSESLRSIPIVIQIKTSELQLVCYAGSHNPQEVPACARNPHRIKQAQVELTVL